MPAVSRQCRNHQTDKTMNDLVHLAELLRQRNDIDRQISVLLGRPVTTGHLGEYIAHKVFEIELMESASHKGSDGFFRSGPLAKRSVNIKFYPKNDGLVSISPNSLPDLFLVLAGPRTAAGSSRGQIRPHVIESVFVFDAHALVAELKSSNVKLGEATSVRQQLWEQAEIYPVQRTNALILTEEQRAMLTLFSSKGGS